jgi:hypothetical protein
MVKSRLTYEKFELTSINLRKIMVKSGLTCENVELTSINFEINVIYYDF